jgi:hypothetical protein
LAMWSRLISSPPDGMICEVGQDGATIDCDHDQEPNR